MTAFWITLIVLAALLGLLWLIGNRRAAVLRQLSTPKKEGRVLQEDALKHIYKAEQKGRLATLQSLGGQLEVGLDHALEVQAGLSEKELIKPFQGEFQLTDSGRSYALHVIRSHRLLERYFADKTGLGELDWHHRAEELEHELSPEAADALSSELGHPTHDPHGDPLPMPEGEWASRQGISALQLEEGRVAKVIHVEDEPMTVYSQLIEAGIFPGMVFKVLERTPDYYDLSAEGTRRRLGNVAVGNLTVVPLQDEEAPDFESVVRLNDVEEGDSCRVVSISRAAREVERRRFMDLGILPGALITNEFSGPSGDPAAYRIRGAVIALRREQAEQIFVKEEG